MDLVTFTEEILNGKLHFLCSATLNSATINSANSKSGASNTEALKYCNINSDI